MQILGAFLGLFGFAALIAGIVLFLPIAAFKSRRELAKRLALCGGVGFVGGLLLSPMEPPKPVSPAEVAAAKQSSEKKAADAAAADAAAKGAAEANIKKQLETETKTLWNSLLAAIDPCDSAAKRVAAAASTGDRYVIYPIATNASKVCSEAGGAVRALKSPSAAQGEIAEAYDTGIDKCGDAQNVRMVAFSKLATLMDGDMRPSAVNEVKEYLEAANQAGMVCAVGMMEAAMKGGLDMKIFQKT